MYKAIRRSREKDRQVEKGKDREREREKLGPSGFGRGGREVKRRDRKTGRSPLKFLRERKVHRTCGAGRRIKD